MGVAAWLAAQAHRDSGPAHFDAADAVTMETLAHLEPLLADSGDDVLAIAGALRFEAGCTAARRGDSGSAWGHWDTARAMSARLPAGYYHPVTSFWRAIMGAHAVTVAVELHAGGESMRQAAADMSAIPSRPRRARHRIEEVRGYQLDGQPEAASLLPLLWPPVPGCARGGSWPHGRCTDELLPRLPRRDGPTGGPTAGPSLPPRSGGARRWWLSQARAGRHGSP